jgi:hypothetical protein
MGNRPVITLKPKTEIETEIKPYDPNWFPPCFESKQQHDEYMWQMQKTSQPFDPLNYCLDCTHEYKVQMLKEGKCEHSETIFVVWKSSHKKSKFTGVISEEPDVLGISNNSRFWDNPIYDQHPDKLKEPPPCL